ncbi:MAG: glycosyltransferase [Coriobacteriia bacterium]
MTTVPVTLEVFLAPLARHFRALGWRVDALANGAAACASLAEGFDACHDVTWTRNPLSPGNLAVTAQRVRRLVAAGGYDLVHVHTPVAAFVTRWALRRMPSAIRPVVIYTAHGFHFLRGQRRLPHAVYRSMEKAAARWTDYLVTINEEDFRAAQSFGTIPTERVRLIPGIGVEMTSLAEGAVTPAGAAEVRHELLVSEDAFLLLMVAEFAPVKRHGHVLDALARVRDPRVVTVFVGAGPLEDAVRAKSRALGLGRHVRFAGYRRDVPALLAASDALILASDREGLPRSVLEAMAAGRPVIGTRIRGIADAVGEDAGWLVDKNDPEALATAIEHAAAHPDETRRRGAIGRVRAAERFALPHIIAEYEELYREALASRA